MPIETNGKSPHNENKTEPRHDKTNKVSVRPVWSESSLSAWRKLGSLVTQWAHSEDSDQTRRMFRLICLRWAHMSVCWFCHEAAQMSRLAALLVVALIWIFSGGHTSSDILPRIFFLHWSMNDHPVTFWNQIGCSVFWSDKRVINNVKATLN